MSEDAESSPVTSDVPETGATVVSVAPVASRRGTHGDEEYTVTFDTDAQFTLTATTVAEFRLYVGKHLAAIDLMALRGADAHQRATEAAARHLGARPRSTREIEEYLRGKGFMPEAVNAAVTRLTERGYLDDAAFAKWYAENRAEFRPRGPNPAAAGVAPQGDRHGNGRRNPDRASRGNRRGRASPRTRPQTCRNPRAWRLRRSHDHAAVAGLARASWLWVRRRAQRVALPERTRAC